MQKKLSFNGHQLSREIRGAIRPVGGVRSHLVFWRSRIYSIFFIELVSLGRSFMWDSLLLAQALGPLWGIFVQVLQIQFKVYKMNTNKNGIGSTVLRITLSINKHIINYIITLVHCVLSPLLFCFLCVHCCWM